jgi:ParB family transcriptional regulator, chromosome partitioning protein
MQKKALGRGLDALFERSLADGASPNHSGQYTDLEVDKIIPNRYQPRKVFKAPELDELAASLKEKGVLQPVIVRRSDGGRYELIAGERRWRAAKIAGLNRIPAVIQDATDGEAVELALIENLQREDLNPIETAKAYRRLTEEFHLTQEEVAKRVGKERSSVTNTLRLLVLPLELQEAIASDALSIGHAKILLSLGSLQAQLRVARQIMKKGLSVRATEAVIKRLGARSRRSPTILPDPIVDAKDRLMRYLGTRVNITAEAEGGQITIRYHDTSDLGRLLDLIIK